MGVGSTKNSSEQARLLRRKAPESAIYQPDQNLHDQTLERCENYYLANARLINEATENSAAIIRTLRTRFGKLLAILGQENVRENRNLKLSEDTFIVSAQVINKDPEVPKPYIILKIEFDEKTKTAKIFVADSFKQSHGKNNLVAPNIGRHSHTRLAEITVSDVKNLNLLKKTIFETSFEEMDFYHLVKYLQTSINEANLGLVEEIIPQIVIDKFPPILGNEMTSYLERSPDGSDVLKDSSPLKTIFFSLNPTVQIRLYGQTQGETPNPVNSIKLTVSESNFRQRGSMGFQILNSKLELQIDPQKLDFVETVADLIQKLDFVTVEIAHILANLFEKNGIHSLRLEQLKLQQEN